MATAMPTDTPTDTLKHKHNDMTYRHVLKYAILGHFALKWQLARAFFHLALKKGIVTIPTATPTAMPTALPTATPKDPFNRPMNMC